MTFLNAVLLFISTIVNTLFHIREFEQKLTAATNLILM